MSPFRTYTQKVILKLPHNEGLESWQKGQDGIFLILSYKFNIWWFAIMAKVTVALELWWWILNFPIKNPIFPPYVLSDSSISLHAFTFDLSSCQISNHREKRKGHKAANAHHIRSNLKGLFRIDKLIESHFSTSSIIDSTSKLLSSESDTRRNPSCLIFERGGARSLKIFK